MSLLLEVKSAEYIDAEENIHDRKISTSFLKWANGAVLGWDYSEEILSNRDKNGRKILIPQK